MVEEWRNVGTDGKYMVSNLGRVWSNGFHVATRDKKGVERQRFCRPQLLKSRVAGEGYLYVTLGARNTRPLHVLVAEAFLGSRPEGADVRHLDGDRANPVATNLAYGSRTENNYDRARHGRYALSVSDVLFIRDTLIPPKLLKYIFPVSRKQIHRIKSRKAWAHV